MFRRSAGSEKLNLPSSRLTGFPVALLSATEPCAVALVSLSSQAASPITSRPIPTYLTRMGDDPKEDLAVLAKRLERYDIDAVIAEGTESGGHVGELGPQNFIQLFHQYSSN